MFLWHIWFLLSWKLIVKGAWVHEEKAALTSPLPLFPALVLWFHDDAPWISSRCPSAWNMFPSGFSSSLRTQTKCHLLREVFWLMCARGDHWTPPTGSPWVHAWWFFTFIDVVLLRSEFFLVCFLPQKASTTGMEALNTWRAGVSHMSWNQAGSDWPVPERFPHRSPMVGFFTGILGLIQKNTIIILPT